MRRALKQPNAVNLRASVMEVVDRHRFLAGVHRLGIAVSGGADSVALLLLLLPLCRKAGIVPVVLHFNHGLRGEVSAGDQQFVRQFAEQAGAAFRTASGNPAAGRGVSLEMAAREARLAFFFDCTRTEALDAVATGHQADDVAETLLLRLARGAGSCGLAGLRPCSVLERNQQHLRLIRPLLDFPRKTLQDWLLSQNISWREDASNQDTFINRNAVRHQLLPRLAKHFGTDISPQLAQSSNILRAEDDFLESLVGSWLAHHAVADTQGSRQDALPIRDLAEQPLALQRRIVRRWLMHLGQAQAAGFEPIASILSRLGQDKPWQITLPGNLHLSGRSGLLAIHREQTPFPTPRGALPLPVPGCVSWMELTISAAMASGIVRERGVPGQWPAACSLAPEAVGARPLLLRTRQPGDRIEPLGMQGTRRLQDLFVDAKLPRSDRDKLPLLCCGETVVWVPGYRVARDFAVRDATAPAIQIRITV